ncbi:MAG: HD domain-containing phosphohydrolase [Nanoarchaeota archaeon]
MNEILKNLASSTLALEDLLANSGDTLIVITNKDKETIRWVSDNVEKITGYEPEELIGKSVKILWKYREERDILKKMVNKEGSIKNYEATLLKKDGTEWQTRFDISLGKTYGTIGIAKDITEERKSRNDLIIASYMLYEEVDTELAIHVERVTEYVTNFLKFLKIDNYTKDKIKLGTRLHDIGKIRLKNKGLLRSYQSFFKNGLIKMFSDKNNPLKEHTELGYLLLKDFDTFNNKLILDVVKYHHERWDGRGYYEKKNYKIPYAARIVALADALDPIINGRRYKEKVDDKGEIIMEFKRNRGIQFDPKLTDIFIKYLKSTEL